MSNKRARLDGPPDYTPNAEVSIENNEITNVDVIASNDYFNNLRTSNYEDYKIITDYRQEIECEEYESFTIETPQNEEYINSSSFGDDDDYVDMTLLSNIQTYPKISYSIINWLLSTKNLNNINDLTFIPSELLCEFITSKDILIKLLKEQLQNAEKMNNALKLFPKITSDYINVFRGVNDAFFNKIMSIIQNNKRAKQVSFPSFLSTSLFIDAAKRFSGSKKIMSIQLPKGECLPYVSSNLDHIRDRGVVSEAEVILPINATLQLLNIDNIITSDGFTIYHFKLIRYIQDIRATPYSKRDKFVTDFGEQIYNKIINKRGGGKLFKKNKRKTRKQKRRNTLKRKTRRQKRRLTKN